MIFDTWHVTRDTWHMTCDMLWGVNILSKFQLPSSYVCLTGPLGWLGTLLPLLPWYSAGRKVKAIFKWIKKIIVGFAWNGKLFLSAHFPPKNKLSLLGLFNRRQRVSACHIPRGRFLWTLGRIGNAGPCSSSGFRIISVLPRFKNLAILVASISWCCVWGISCLLSYHFCPQLQFTSAWEPGCLLPSCLPPCCLPPSCLPPCCLPPCCLPPSCLLSSCLPAFFLASGLQNFPKHRMTASQPLRNNILFVNVKNPAYGRQSISWPMRIVAPLPRSF